MGNVSVIQQDSLYWLGRYSERVYTTIRLFSGYFDEMIDMKEPGYYHTFCRQLEIPDIYWSDDDFMRRYCFDETNTDSIAASLQRAYDNGVVLRELLGSDALSYIQMAVYEMRRAAVSEAPLIELQKVQDDILAFWGITDDDSEDARVRDVMKMGRRVERVDLYARIHTGRKELMRAVERLTSFRFHRSGLPYREECLVNLQECLMQEHLDYDEILRQAEQILAP